VMKRMIWKMAASALLLCVGYGAARAHARPVPTPGHTSPSHRGNTRGARKAAHLSPGPAHARRTARKAAHTGSVAGVLARRPHPGIRLGLQLANSALASGASSRTAPTRAQR